MISHWGSSKTMLCNEYWLISLVNNLFLHLRMMKEGFKADGNKAEKELGLKYTPIYIALEEQIAAEKK